MTDPTAIHAHLSTLTASLDALTAALAPLLATPPAALAADLPPRDAARLHILAAYAPESLLFNAMRLAAAAGGQGDEEEGGADAAKKHPVVAELQRVRKYAARLRDAEAAQRGPAMRVDAAAAKRFVRAGIGPSPAAAEKGDRGGRAKAGAEEASAGAAGKRDAEGRGAGDGGADGSPGSKKQRKEERRGRGAFGQAQR
jgi:exosome complex protein LRP1